jgi:hypothetical protein
LEPQDASDSVQTGFGTSIRCGYITNWICVRCLACCYKEKKMKVPDRDRDSANEPDYAYHTINVDDRQEQTLSPIGDICQDVHTRETFKLHLDIVLLISRFLHKAFSNKCYCLIIVYLFLKK